MSLTRLLIRDFRNIESADLALSPGFNFLVGANGSGKTSVLEAIYTLGHGRAFRSLQIGRVIRHEQESFVLHGRLQGEERETAIGLTKDKQGDSKVRIDGTDGHKVAELALLMPIFTHCDIPGLRPGWASNVIPVLRRLSSPISHR